MTPTTGTQHRPGACVATDTAVSLDGSVADPNDSRQASTHYLNRCGREIQTVQTTFLVDTAQGAVIDVHRSTKWPNGTKIDPQIALRNAGDLLTLAADKDYDDMSFCEELRAEGVRPLIKHRVFAPYDHAHNARIDDDLSHQRPICETVNSVIKRSYGPPSERGHGIVSFVKSLSLPPSTTSNKPSNSEIHRPPRIQ